VAGRACFFAAGLGLVLRLGPDELDLEGLLEREGESLSERSEELDLSLDESARLACLMGLRGPEELDLEGLSERDLESSESDLSELLDGFRAAGRLAGGRELSEFDLSESEREREEPERERERDLDLDEREPDLERERDERESLSLFERDLLDFLLLLSSSLLVLASRSRWGGKTERGLALAASMASRFFRFCARTTKIGMRIIAATPIAEPTTITAMITPSAVADTTHWLFSHTTVLLYALLHSALLEQALHAPSLEQRGVVASKVWHSNEVSQARHALASEQKGAVSGHVLVSSLVQVCAVVGIMATQAKISIKTVTRSIIFKLIVKYPQNYVNLDRSG
jgi:hypothetical protein